MLEGSRSVSGKVPSSCLIWGISRAASTVAFIPDYIILKTLPESENAFKGLAFWLRFLFVSTQTKLSVQTGYLVSAWVTNQYFCCKKNGGKRRSFGNDFIFLCCEEPIWESSDLYCRIRYNLTKFRKITLKINPAKVTKCSMRQCSICSCIPPLYTAGIATVWRQM